MYEDEKSIRRQIGENIRFYRRERNLTIEQLGKSIGKSKSIVSKYENGIVSLDIDSLWKIAETLGIKMSKLTELKGKKKQREKKKKTRNPFGQEEIFLYYYDGRMEEYVKSYIRIVYNKFEKGYDAFYYLGLKEYENYQESDFIYKGKMYSYDLVTHFHFVNLVNPMDHMMISICNPIHREVMTSGILLAMLEHTVRPYAVKVCVSLQMIFEKDMRKEMLTISEKEWKDLYFLLPAEENI